MSRRVDKLDGSFGGVVLATMAMSHFNQYYHGYDIGAAGTITLLQSNGSLLARHPFSEEAMGSLLGDDPLYRDEILVRALGTLRATREDGREHLVAFRHLERYPLAVVVTQSRDERLAAEISRCRRERAPLSLLLLDVDHFKPFNDHYGHLAGDDCLREVAGVIRHIATHRGGDFAARYGGEGFAVLLPNTPGDGALQVAERLRDAVAAMEREHAASPLGHLTLSIGLTTLDPEDSITTAESLVGRADEALYGAKEGRRDRVVAAPAGDAG